MQPMERIKNLLPIPFKFSNVVLQIQFGFQVFDNTYLN